MKHYVRLKAILRAIIKYFKNKKIKYLIKIKIYLFNINNNSTSSARDVCEKIGIIYIIYIMVAYNWEIQRM